MTDSSEDQKENLASFLDSKERDKILLAWLEEIGLTGWKAKLIVKGLLPILYKYAGQTVTETLTWTDETLKKRFDWYAKWSGKVGEMLQQKILGQAATGEILGCPPNYDPKQWDALKDETKTHIKTLEKLDAIALSLDELKARVELRLLEPDYDENSRFIELLHPNNEFIPFLGREDIKPALIKWALEDSAFSWRVIIGEAGAGKTRLARKITSELRVERWDAGFLNKSDLNTLVNDAGFKQNWRPLVDTLIIVDYAAPKQEDLTKLLARLLKWNYDVRKDPERPRLRLLLLDRNAEKDRGWLNRLIQDPDSAFADKMREAGEILELKGVPTDDTTETILRETLAAWGKLKKLTPPTLPDLGPEERRHLREQMQGRPLYLQMAALHACELGDASNLLRWTREDLLKSAVERERRAIAQQIGDEGTRLITERAIALLFFVREMAPDQNDLKTLIEEEAEACGYPGIQPGSVANHLFRLYPNTGEEAAHEKSIHPIQPDLIGATFAVTVLQEKPNQITASLNRAIEINPKDAWSFLLLATQDLYGVGDYEPEKWLKPLIQGRTKDELWKIIDPLPWDTVALRQFGEDVYEALRDHPDGFTDSEEEARIIGNLSKYYGDLGDREAALETARRAVEIREKLAAKNPDAFYPDLATSLNNLGNSYSALGDREAARDTFARGIEVLSPGFFKVPKAFQGLIVKLLTVYMDACKKSGQVPDGELLGPIVEKLRELEGEDK